METTAASLGIERRADNGETPVSNTLQNAIRNRMRDDVALFTQS
ncbi:hypothetical protein BRPE64_ECDS02280 (plasmid) [Caballeronia insecticola]|uniref:Uncharacterized protein n=1 Tax=Caballeronia insecticola TaxID=758793 RepID=A0A060PRN4_9BURK|nr:hypothetical protein BRPE64_ECDS02280 [Caballeronia insecticola]